MPLLATIVDFILHIDTHLTELTAAYGFLTYLILFLIVFAETGFVITPFLPGDSLLFASGAIAALGSLNLFAVLTVLIAAAILGDTVNYFLGHTFGQQMIKNPKLPIKPEHIDKTNAFYAKHGGKTIILARSVPIVRTFAPFVAGVGHMNYRHFLLYNIVGGCLWVLLFTLAGFFFGNLPAVKHNFTLVIPVIIGLSLVPVIFEALHRRPAPSKPSA